MYLIYIITLHNANIRTLQVWGNIGVEGFANPSFYCVMQCFIHR
jgi:hypothetical protein